MPTYSFRHSLRNPDGTLTEYRHCHDYLWVPKMINGKIKWLTDAVWQESRTQVPKFNWFNVIGGPMLVWTKWKAIEWSSGQ